ncbi:MAG: hypothetical protein ABSG62_14615 [Terracidiphilus sp.]|jgi:hypothetical protein
MTLSPCSRENEVLELLARGHWPQACTPDLRAHLAACRSCADLLLVTHAFQLSRATAAAQANLPAPGVLWWRAQLRRRNAAVERVAKPILGAHIFALSITLFVALALVVSQARHGLQWLNWLAQLPQPQIGSLHLESLWPSTLSNPGWSLTVLIPVFATLALLSAVVVYLASEKQ